MPNTLPIIYFCLFIGFFLEGCTQKTITQRQASSLEKPSLGNAKIGKQLYDEQCLKCHKTSPGNNRKGPQLQHIYGNTAGLITEYNYSNALKNSKITWDVANLDAYIKHPKTHVPDTKMLFDGLTNEKDRQDIIAYMATL